MPNKIYDCFTFFNEYELLNIRFHEHYDYVDKFVIVESSESFTGTPKPFRFEEAMSQYSQFLDKIIYIKLHEHQETNNPWAREHWQRNQISRGLNKCDPDDLILISDCDEIVPGPMIQKLKNLSKNHKFIGFIQKLHIYRLNRLWESHQEFEWKGLGAAKYKDFMSPQYLRAVVHFGTPQVTSWQRGGWHFSHMGDKERVMEKVNNYSHSTNLESEYKLNDEEYRTAIDAHRLVKIDTTYPQYIQDNVDLLIEQNFIDQD